MKLLTTSAIALALAFASLGSFAQEATIRKNLTERLPKLPPIDEISKTPMEGLYEVRVNQSEIFYTDAQGNFLIQGNLIDVRAQEDLTEKRQAKLTEIDFKDLPIKDAFTIVRGNGKRKVAVFEDPNCGYCKRFERDLAAIKDVTVYTFLLPILGPDSNVKSRDIWCSKEAAKSWRAWMIDGVAPARTMGQCDSAALERNVEFARKYRINGTPALFFEDGTRKPGALPQAEVEKLLVAAAKK